MIGLAGASRKKFFGIVAHYLAWESKEKAMQIACFRGTSTSGEGFNHLGYSNCDSVPPFPCLKV